MKPPYGPLLPTAYTTLLRRSVSRMIGPALVAIDAPRGVSLPRCTTAGMPSAACSVRHRRPSRRSASSTYHFGCAFGGSPCEEGRRRCIPHRDPAGLRRTAAPGACHAATQKAEH